MNERDVNTYMGVFPVLMNNTLSIVIAAYV